MRVLHVIAGLPARGGGPTAAVVGMVAQSRILGLEAEVATTDSNIWGNLSVPLGEKVIEQDVPRYYFRSPMLRRYGYSPGLARWLRTHIRAYDLLHIHGVFAHPTISAAASAWKADVPYIIRPCGELDAWPLRKNRILKRYYLRLVGRRILNQAEAVHAASAAEKVGIERLGVKTNVVTVPLGVEIPSVMELSSHGQFRKQYPELEGKKLILFLSRIDNIKGMDLLLPALKRVTEKRKDVILVIAGSGNPSFERQVRRWVADLGLDRFVMFCGFLDGHRKQAALRDADLFVLPSYHENFGIAAVEAMAAGLPVVISDQVGIHQEVRECEAGLVTRCDAGEVAEALLNVLEDDSLRRRMGENGRRLVQEKFTWSRVGVELVKLYQSIVAARRPIVA